MSRRKQRKGANYKGVLLNPIFDNCTDLGAARNKRMRALLEHYSLPSDLPICRKNKEELVRCLFHTHESQLSQNQSLPGLSKVTEPELDDMLNDLTDEHVPGFRITAVNGGRTKRWSDKEKLKLFYEMTEFLEANEPYGWSPDKAAKYLLADYQGYTKSRALAAKFRQLRAEIDGKELRRLAHYSEFYRLIRQTWRMELALFARFLHSGNDETLRKFLDCADPLFVRAIMVWLLPVPTMHTLLGRRIKSEEWNEGFAELASEFCIKNRS